LYVVHILYLTGIHNIRV
jgi:hypothetical protein